MSKNIEKEVIEYRDKLNQVIPSEHELISSLPQKKFLPFIFNVLLVDKSIVFENIVQLLINIECEMPKQIIQKLVRRDIVGPDSKKLHCSPRTIVLFRYLVHFRKREYCPELQNALRFYTESALTDPYSGINELLIYTISAVKELRCHACLPYLKKLVLQGSSHLS